MNKDQPSTSKSVELTRKKGRSKSKNKSNEEGWAYPIDHDLSKPDSNTDDKLRKLHLSITNLLSVLRSLINEWNDSKNMTTGWVQPKIRRNFTTPANLNLSVTANTNAGVAGNADKADLDAKTEKETSALRNEWLSRSKNLKKSAVQRRELNVMKSGEAKLSANSSFSLHVTFNESNLKEKNHSGGHTSCKLGCKILEERQNFVMPDLRDKYYKSLNMVYETLTVINDQHKKNLSKSSSQDSVWPECFSLPKDYKGLILEIDTGLANYGPISLPISILHGLSQLLHRLIRLAGIILTFEYSIESGTTPNTPHHEILSLVLWIHSLGEILVDTTNLVETFYYVMELSGHFEAKEEKVDSTKHTQHLSLHKIPEAPPAPSPRFFERLSKIETTPLDENDIQFPIDPNDSFCAKSTEEILKELPTADIEFWNIFLALSQKIWTPDKLWEKLLKLYYNTELVKLNPNHRQRVILLILQWLSTQIDTLNVPLLNEIVKFAHFLENDTTLEWPQIGPKLIDTLEKQWDKRNSPIQVSDDIKSTLKIYNLKLSQNDDVHTRLVVVYDPELIAKQLTLIDMEIYKHILPGEIFGKKWSNPEMQLFSGNVISLIKRVNMVSYWVATEILMQPKLLDRILIMKKMLEVASHLLNLGSFNSFMGVIMAFNTSCISRLKATFLRFSKSKKSANLLKVYQEICSPLRNFKALREQMNINREYISVPYMGICLNDYTLIDEKSPDFVGKKMVNLPKWKLLFNCVSSFLNNQKFVANTPFSHSEPLYTLLHTLPTLSEIQLFTLSKQIEKT
eukprot:TRINITY_DN19936_c0_g1_i7.p1 TRINITY_DN19936_c0_g1~~TRINITY_DN19936_c0_g1_i7.p1  ORF type:complete len:796 (+),score=153.58 TRINITY_DN19936_c0_g1_i7:51-2438(+)